jgi:hypothetical protein
VDDQLVGELVNAWRIDKWAVRELGKLEVKPAGEVFADLAELLFDYVIVVDQPFRIRCQRLVVADRFNNGPVGCGDKLAIVFEPTDQTPIRSALAHDVTVGQLFGVRPQMFGTKRFAAKRRLLL